MRAPKPPPPPAFCIACGSELAEDGTFCSKCGKSVKPNEFEPEDERQRIPRKRSWNPMQEAFEGAPKWVKIPCGCCSLYILAMIVLVVGAIVVGVIWAAVDSDDADDTSRQDEANETVPTLSGPGGIGVIGETMVSPPYALTVDYKPSVALSVGKGPEADGRFVIVPIRVTNVGTGGIDMFTNAKLALIDEDDRRFEAAPLAVQSTFGGLVVQPIDPGDTYEGVVVFDVPRDATQLHLEVDGSLFARTVTIDLGVFP